MNGVMLGRGEKGQFLFQLVDFGGGGADERAVNGIETLQHWTRRRRAGTGRGLTGYPELSVQLGIASLEHANQGTVRQRRTDGLDVRKLLASAENVEKRQGLALNLAECQ